MTDFFHVSRTTGKKGRALAHSRYITRDGSSANDLVATGYGNMPPGVVPPGYWGGTDKFERKNGVAYRELVVALSRALRVEENIRTTEEISRKVAGTRPFEFAVHCPRAALEGGEQPHAHIMISDRIPDGIERPLNGIFRRFNRDQPERGGWQKVPSPSKPELRKQLVEQRKVCADVINESLSRAGIDQRVDHRSHRERGLPTAKARHLGPVGVRKLKEAAARESARSTNF